MIQMTCGRHCNSRAVHASALDFLSNTLCGCVVMHPLAPLHSEDLCNTLPATGKSQQHNNPLNSLDLRGSAVNRSSTVIKDISMLSKCRAEVVLKSL
jgi:hypothetical protein